MASAVLLGMLAASCARSGGTPTVGAPDIEGFDPSLIVDVLSPDSIAAITEPRFESGAAAAGWLGEDEPVLALELGGHARAYPLAIMTWHEIVDDLLGGRRVAVTFCPLCNTGIVYDRTVRGKPLTFGVSGKLYQSDLVMYDRETRSLWPQVLGVAVLGDLKGERLEPLPSSMVSFAEFRSAYPDGEVLQRPPGRAYGSNPYPGYDSRKEPISEFFEGDPDGRLPSMERVVAVVLGRSARAYPYSKLAARGNPSVVADRVGAEEIVLFWGGGARSALDAGTIAFGRAVGSSGVFRPTLDGRALTFSVRGGRILDDRTGSVWSLLGRAESGPLEGARLQAIHHLDAFWFAWEAFVPLTEIWSG